MIDLSSIRAKLRTNAVILEPGAPLGGFLTVSDWSSAVEAIANGDAEPPCAYVSLSRETPDANRRSSGGSAQRVRSIISVLFCLGASRADEERSDPIEIARGSTIQTLNGFRPGGSIVALRYAGYQLRAETDDLVWGEVLFSTSWDLTSAT